MSTLNTLKSSAKNSGKYIGALVVVSLMQLLAAQKADAQVSVGPNAQMHIQNGASIYVPGVSVDSGAIHGKGTITNYGDWIANTPVMADTDSIHTKFEGTTQQVVAGSVAPNMYKVTVNNPAGLRLGDTLTTETQVRDTLKMTQGVVDLNGQYINFGFTGTLDENDTSYVFDNVNNGGLKASAVLNNPINANPANVGLEITGGGNMDTTHIVTNFMEKVPGAGSFLSHTVTPKNQPTGNVTVTLAYKQHHTQIGMGDPTLYDIHRNDGGTWLPTGGVSDVPNSIVSVVLSDGFKDGLTIANMGDPLSVDILDFYPVCEGGYATLYWSTATEINSNHFEVEKSTDALNRHSIGSLPTAGTTTQTQSYIFKDPTANDGITYYRIVEHDNDGQETPYYKKVSIHCQENIIDDMNIFPNPNEGKFTLEIKSMSHGQIPLRVFNMTGQLVYEESVQTVNGTVQYHIDLSNLAPGVYAFDFAGSTKRVVIAK